MLTSYISPDVAIAVRVARCYAEQTLEDHGFEFLSGHGCVFMFIFVDLRCSNGMISCPVCPTLYLNKPLQTLTTERAKFRIVLKH